MQESQHQPRYAAQGNIFKKRARSPLLNEFQNKRLRNQEYCNSVPPQEMPCLGSFPDYMRHTSRAPVATHRRMYARPSYQRMHAHNNPHKLAYAGTEAFAQRLMLRKSQNNHSQMAPTMKSEQPVTYDLTTPSPPLPKQASAYARIPAQGPSQPPPNSAQYCVPSYTRAQTQSAQVFLTTQDGARLMRTKTPANNGNALGRHRVAELGPAIWSIDAGKSHAGFKNLQCRTSENHELAMRQGQQNESLETTDVFVTPNRLDINAGRRTPHSPAGRNLASEDHHHATSRLSAARCYKQEDYNGESPTLEEMMKRNKGCHSTNQHIVPTYPHKDHAIEHRRANTIFNSQENHDIYSKDPAAFSRLGRVFIDLSFSPPSLKAPIIPVPMRDRISAPQKPKAPKKARVKQRRLTSKDKSLVTEYQRQRLAALRLMQREQIGEKQAKDIELFGEVVGEPEELDQKRLDEARARAQGSEIREEEALVEEQNERSRLLEVKRLANEAIRIEKEVVGEDKRRKREARNKKIAEIEAARTEVLRQKAADTIEGKRQKEAFAAAVREARKRRETSTTQADRDELAKLVAKLKASKQQDVSLPSLTAQKDCETTSTHLADTKLTDMAMKETSFITTEMQSSELLPPNTSETQGPASMTELFARATAGKRQLSDDDREDDRQLRLRQALAHVKKNKNLPTSLKHVSKDDLEILAKGGDVVKNVLTKLKEQRESTKRGEKEDFLRLKSKELSSKSRGRKSSSEDECRRGGSSKRWASSRVRSQRSHQHRIRCRSIQRRYRSRSRSEGCSSSRLSSRSRERHGQGREKRSSGISIPSSSTTGEGQNEAGNNRTTANEHASSSTESILSGDASQQGSFPPKITSQVMFLTDLQRAQVEADIKAKTVKDKKKKDEARAEEAAGRQLKNVEARRRKGAENARLKFEIEVRGHASKEKKDLTEEEIKQKVDAMMEDRERKQQIRINAAVKTRAKRPCRAKAKSSSQNTVTSASPDDTFSSELQQTYSEHSTQQQNSHAKNHTESVKNEEASVNNRKQLEDLTTESLRALRGLRPASQPQKMADLSDSGDSDDESDEEQPFTKTANSLAENDVAEGIIEYPIERTSEEVPSSVAPHANDSGISAISVPPGDPSSSSVKVYKAVEITNTLDEEPTETILTTVFERAEANNLAAFKFQKLQELAEQTATIAEIPDGQYFHGKIDNGEDGSIVVTVKPDFVPQDKLHNFDTSMLKPLFPPTPYMVFQSITKQVVTTEHRETPSLEKADQKSTTEVRCEKTTKETSVKWLFTDRELANKKACDHALELMRPRRARIDDPHVIAYQGDIVPPIRNQFKDLQDDLMDVEIELDEGHIPWLDFVGLHVWVEQFPMYGPIN